MTQRAYQVSRFLTIRSYLSLICASHPCEANRNGVVVVFLYRYGILRIKAIRVSRASGSAVLSLTDRSAG